MAISNKVKVDLLRDNPQLFKWVVLSGDVANGVADAVLHYLKLDADYMLTSGQSVMVRVCEDGSSIQHDVRGWHVPVEYWEDDLMLQFNVSKVFLQHRIYMTSLDSHSVVWGEFLTETKVVELEDKLDEVRNRLADALREKALTLANRHMN